MNPHFTYLVNLMVCVTVTWLLPVKDHPNLAKCQWCNLVTSRSYLFQHAKSAKHVRNVGRFIANKRYDPDSKCAISSLAAGVYPLAISSPF